MNSSGVAIVLISIASLALWIGDAVMDAFVFRTGTFSDVLLFHLSAHEIYSRSLLIAILVTVGVVLARTVLLRSRAPKAFQESNETLLKLADTAKDAIVLIDNEGRISFWNYAAERICGYSSHEAIGRELHALLAPQRYQRTYQGSFLRFRDSGLDSTSGRTLELRAVRKGKSQKRNILLFRHCQRSRLYPKKQCQRSLPQSNRPHRHLLCLISWLRLSA